MKNKSKLNTVLLVIIIILLTISLVYFFSNNSKIDFSNNITQNNQTENNLSHTVLKLENECSSSVDKIRLLDLIIRDNGSLEAKTNYKIVPSKYNNYSFSDDTCSLLFSKMIVFGVYGEDGLYSYEFNKFNKLNTWENYMSNRSDKKEYLTNVFSVSKNSGEIVLEEIYQE